MNKMLSAIACALLLSAVAVPPVFAAVKAKPDMKLMNTHFKAASAAQDVGVLKTELIALRDLTRKTQTEAQAIKNPSDQDKIYWEGINKLLIEIDQSVALAEAGKYDEAKASLGKIKTLRGEFHKKLGI